MNKKDKILGALFGVACGDALGATLQFIDKKTGECNFGYLNNIIGGGVMRLKPGEVTDDTMMTIAVAEGILQDKSNPIEFIGKQLLKWYDENPKDIGITNQLSIEKFKLYGNWSEASLKTYESLNGKTNGSGSLKRCLPIAISYENFNEMIGVTSRQSYMTHQSRQAEEACIIYNSLIYKYFHGEEKMEALKEVLKKHEKYQKVLTMNKNELKPYGDVTNTLISSLYCFINENNCENIICEAVNLYGESDTVGSMAGGLAGVYYGFNALPYRWIDKILIRDKLIIIGEQLNRVVN